MKKLFDLAGVVLVVTISFGAFFGLLFFLRAFGQPLWSSDAAGWAQAIGTVAAIIGAVWAATHASGSERRAKKEDDHEASITQLVFARIVCAQGMYAIENLLEALKSTNLERIEAARERVHMCLEALQALYFKSNNHEVNRVLAEGYEILLLPSTKMTFSSNPAASPLEVQHSVETRLWMARDWRAGIDRLAEKIGAPARNGYQ